MIKRDWKIVREGAEKGTWRLYNLSQERIELTDHAEHMPEEVKEIGNLWETRFGSP